MKYSLFAIGFIIFCVGGIALFFTSFETVQNTITQVFTSNSVIYSAEDIDNQNNNTKNENSEKIEFTFYHDFSCPYCSEFFTQTFIPLQKKYNEQISFSILPYALNPEGKSFEMSVWFVCLQKEKIKDEEIISKLLNETKKDSLSELFTLSQDQNIKVLECIDNEETISSVKKIRDDAKKRGVRGTPTFFIGDEKFEKNQSLKKVELKLIEILGE